MTPAAAASDYGKLSPHVRIRRVEAVINHAAGSVGPGADEALCEILADYALDATVAAPDPSGISAAVAEALARKPDLLIVLAGDGTAALAAGSAGPDGPLVMPLPGGTMNMLPHALYGRVGWKDALVEALSNGVERPVSGGLADGRPFYVAAILGAPALWAEAREAIRAGRPREALRRAMRALSLAFKGRLRFRLDGGPRIKAEALTLMCPLVSRVMQDDTALEAAALDVHNAIEAFRLGALALAAAVPGVVGVDWRNDPSVTSQPVRRATAWASGRIPAVLDGEPVRLPRKVEIAFNPLAFRALAPPPAETAPDRA
jgi:diacylglycerol kinase family enzyme